MGLILLLTIVFVYITVFTIYSISPKDIEDPYEHYYSRESRIWWLALSEEKRREMIKDYFGEGDADGVSSLYGMMPEELEEIYLKNK